MISVTIHRKTLEKHGACADGLALYDAIAAMLPEDDARRHKRIRIANWTPLHSIWPYAAGCGSFARWLEDRGIIPRANLAGADLRGAYLRGANLAGADLRGADLRGADLDGAYLRGASLAGANLDGANLAGANLAGANLDGAYLAGANLAGANLDGAYLDGAFRGLSAPVPGWRTLASGYLERES